MGLKPRQTSWWQNKLGDLELIQENLYSLSLSTFSHFYLS